MGDVHNACVVPFKIRVRFYRRFDDIDPMDLACVDPECWHEEFDPGEDILTDEELCTPIKLKNRWVQTCKMDDLEDNSGVYGYRLVKDNYIVWAVNESPNVAVGAVELSFVSKDLDSLLEFCKDMNKDDLLENLETDCITRCTC